MEVKVYRKFCDIKESYIRCFENSNARVFQKHYMISSMTSLPFRLKRKSPLKCYAVYESGIAKVICPIWKYGGDTAYIVGSREGFEFVDIIHDRLSDIVLQDFYKELFIKMKSDGISLLTIKWLDESSQTYRCLQNLEEKGTIRIHNFTEIPNVCIYLKEPTYDEYFKRLSKHVRQNVRTAYNRLKKDNKVVQFDLFFLKTIDDYKKNELLLNEAMCLYLRRHENRYEKKTTIKYRINREFQYLTRTIKLGDGVFGGLRDIETQKLVGFFEGYYDEYHNEIAVPRLAIDDKYSFYSPGMILVNEAVKYLYDKTSIRSLNLARGDEKYKYDMGGETYNTVSLDIRIDDLNIE